jgi:hypothetical protein
MKTTTLISTYNGRAAGRCGAFSLMETMIATALFLLMVGAALGAHVFGLSMFNIVAPKLSSVHEARSALNHMRDEVRSSQGLRVGSGDNNGFVLLATNVARAGNALQIYPTAATNNFILYYVDAKAQQLKRVTSAGGAAELVASSVINPQAFQAEDYAGNVLTNDLNNRVIKLTLEFRQWSGVARGENATASSDYYQVHTRMTRRAL